MQAEPVVFTFATIVLLSVPGPTNLMLAAGGLCGKPVGVSGRAAAALAGYLMAIAIWLVLFSFLARLAPQVTIVVNLLCALYLIQTAWRLWTSSTLPQVTRIGPRHIFIATISNPKAFVIASAFPVLGFWTPSAAVYWVILALVCGLASSIWAVAGSSLRGILYGRRAMAIIYRSMSLILVGFAAVIGVMPLIHKVV